MSSNNSWGFASFWKSFLLTILRHSNYLNSFIKFWAIRYWLRGCFSSMPDCNFRESLKSLEWDSIQYTEVQLDESDLKELYKDWIMFSNSFVSSGLKVCELGFTSSMRVNTMSHFLSFFMIVIKILKSFSNMLLHSFSLNCRNKRSS